MRENDFPDWLTPRWWTDSHDPTITRVELIDKWVDAAAAPKPEKNVFVPELSSWSTALGPREWVAERYTPTGASLAWKSVKAASGDAEGWWQVSLLYAEFGDPLARFSGKFRLEAQNRRPRGLPGPLSRVIREFERGQACIAARDALLNPEVGNSVLATEVDAEDFLEAPDQRFDEVLAASMRGYATALLNYMNNKVAPSETALRASLEECIAELSEFGEVDGAERSATEEENQYVTGLLNEVVRKHPKLLKRDPEILNAAWASVHKTLTNRLIAGKEVTSAVMLFTRIRDIQKTFDSTSINRARREQSYEVLTSDGETHDLARVDGPTKRDSTERVEFRTILRHIRSELENYPASVTVDDAEIHCWEKQYALSIIDSGVEVIDHLDMAHLSPIIAQLWEHGKPSAARSATAEQAAKDIQTMLRITASMVIDSADDINLARAATNRTSSRDRTAAFDGTLENNRGKYYAEMEKK